MTGSSRYIQAFSAHAAGDLRPGEMFKVMRTDGFVRVDVYVGDGRFGARRDWSEALLVLDAHPRAEAMGRERAASLLIEARWELKELAAGA